MSTVSAGMPPYFFPYLGYFDLIAHVDIWVVFDTPQYIKGGWVNRNRILSPDNQWRYITVPVKKAPLSTPINQMEISDHTDWRSKIRNALSHYATRAPYFRPVSDLVEDGLEYKTSRLSELNLYALEKVCAYLGISFPYLVLSKSNLHLGEICRTQDWAIRITQALGATVLLNPPGGRSIYVPNEFAEHGIRLIFRDFPPMEYRTEPYRFEPNLSIIDVMMWNSPEQIRTYLASVRCHLVFDCP